MRAATHSLKLMLQWCYQPRSTRWGEVNVLINRQSLIGLPFISTPDISSPGRWNNESDPTRWIFAVCLGT